MLLWRHRGARGGQQGMATLMALFVLGSMVPRGYASDAQPYYPLKPKDTPPLLDPVRVSVFMYYVSHIHGVAN